MVIIDVIVGLMAGVGSTLFLIFMLQREWALATIINLKKLTVELQQYVQQRMELQREIGAILQEIPPLQVYQ